MKTLLKLLICVSALFTQLTAIAQDDLQRPENMPISSGEIEWLTFKDEIGEAKLSKKELSVKSKKSSYLFGGTKLPKPTMSYAKVPLNMKGDFYMSMTFEPSKVDSKTMFGVPFNVFNESDYNVIAFDEQFCYFLRVQKLNGIFLISDGDRVRYKYKKKKDKMWTVAIERRDGGDYVFYLNDIEVRTLSSSFEFNFPALGLWVDNKGELKATHYSFKQFSQPTETE